MTFSSDKYNPQLKSFRAFTGGGGGSGGGGGMDIKVKVSASDTTTDYLSSKLSSADGTVTFSILNPSGDEEYNISIAPIAKTVAEFSALIGSNSLIPSRLYLITDANSGTCQIFVWALTVNKYDHQGFGTFTNVNTPTPIQCLMKYDSANDVVTEVYIPSTNVRVTQSFDAVLGKIGNAIDVWPFGVTIFVYNLNICDSTFSNVDSLDSDLNNTNITYCTINCNSVNCSFTNCNIYNSTMDLISVGIDSSTILNATISCYSGSILQHSFIDGANVSLFNSAMMQSCNVMEGATVVLDDNDFIRCNIGQAKTVIPLSGYNATNSSIEDLDSTFEVFLNPNGSGVMNMVNYKFAGIVRIGTSGTPATWDLKQITNFPTDHIFCVVPADSSTVDIYDVSTAGVGGNLYLQTAATVTYDGSKDDTIVLRSGLNNYTRLFQIGGWQAPSA